MVQVRPYCLSIWMGIHTDNDLFAARGDQRQGAHAKGSDLYGCRALRTCPELPCRIPKVARRDKDFSSFRLTPAVTSESGSPSDSRQYPRAPRSGCTNPRPQRRSRRWDSGEAATPIVLGGITLPTARACRYKSESHLSKRQSTFLHRAFFFSYAKIVHVFYISAFLLCASRLASPLGRFPPLELCTTPSWMR